jgi:hypothetical protein
MRSRDELALVMSKAALRSSSTEDLVFVGCGARAAQHAAPAGSDDEAAAAAVVGAAVALLEERGEFAAAAEVVAA